MSGAGGVCDEMTVQDVERHWDEKIRSGIQQERK